MVEDTRSRGLLSRSELEYLRGESGIESKSQAERTMRSRVRGHIIQGIEEFDLIEDALEPRDRRQIFERYGNAAPTREPNEFQQGVNQLLKFIYHGLRENGVDVEQVFERAIQGGEAGYLEEHKGGLPRMTKVDITVETARHRDAEEVRSRLREGEPVRVEDLEVLAEPVEDEREELESVVIKTGLSPHASVMEVEELEDRVRGILQRKGYLVDTVELVTDEES